MDNRYSKPKPCVTFNLYPLQAKPTMHFPFRISIFFFNQYHTVLKVLHFSLLCKPLSTMKPNALGTVGHCCRCAPWLWPANGACKIGGVGWRGVDDIMDLHLLILFHGPCLYLRGRMGVFYLFVLFLSSGFAFFLFLPIVWVSGGVCWLVFCIKSLRNSFK